MSTNTYAYIEQRYTHNHMYIDMSKIHSNTALYTDTHRHAAGTDMNIHNDLLTQRQTHLGTLRTLIDIDTDMER